jgi:uncharacterized protein DUF4242
MRGFFAIEFHLKFQKTKFIMKLFFVLVACTSTAAITPNLFAQTPKPQLASVTAKQQTSSVSKKLYIDVHHLGAGKVTAKDVAAAHQKDLAVEQKYGVSFLKYWVDEAKGDVYCLSSAASPEAIRKTHGEAHGLLPDQILEVTSGKNATLKGKNNLYLDRHELGAGNVNAKAVAEAHKKDLAVQKKYGVNLINYWVDEKNGTVMCLAQAPDSIALIKTHKDAHGLIPASVMLVKQGQ